MNMKKKKLFIVIALIIAVVVCALIFLCAEFIGNAGYASAEEQITVHIKLDTKEDIGLLIYDYSANEKEFSGGTSNADKSLIKRNSDIILGFDKQELQIDSNLVTLSLEFRIITEYVEPNFENEYPESLTKRLNPITLETEFGESYYITITGDKESGYKVVQS